MRPIKIRREAKMFPHLMVQHKRGSFQFFLTSNYFISKKIKCYTSVIVKQPFQGESMLSAEEEAGHMVNAGLYRASAPKGSYSSRPWKRCFLILYLSSSWSAKSAKRTKTNTVHSRSDWTVVFIPLGTNWKMKGRLQVVIHMKKWLEKRIKKFSASGVGNIH